MNGRGRVVACVTPLVLVLAAASCQKAPEPLPKTGPIQVGALAPAFHLPSAQGKTVSLSDFSGKPVLLYFSMGPG